MFALARRWRVCLRGRSDHASRRTVTNMYTDLSRATSDFCPVLPELVQSRRAVGRTGRVYEGLAALSTINNLHFTQFISYKCTKPVRYAPLKSDWVSEVRRL